MTPQGLRDIDAVERFVDITYANGQLRGAVVVFFDEQTKLSWWVYGYAAVASQPAILELFRREAALYVTDGELVFFTMRGWSLAIRTSTDRANSLEDALASAVSAVETRKAAYAAPGALKGDFGLYELVPLHDLSKDFFLLTEPTAAPPPPPRIVDVSFLDGKWEVTLRGPNMDHAVITLNASYELQGIRRIE